jgi:hypothetical protein
MTQIYTEENLIQYYYKESDLFETFEIEDALENDEVLLHKFMGIRLILDNLPAEASMHPSRKAVNKILEHSKNLSVFA